MPNSVTTILVKFYTNKQNILNTSQKFIKRHDTTDKGKEYENLLVVYYSVKLVLDEEASGFEISCNDAEYGDFDDLVINLFTQNGIQQFNIQVKHKQNDENKKLPLQSLHANQSK